MSRILFVDPVDELTLKREVNGTMLLATRLLQAGFDAQVLRFAQIGSFGGEYGTFIRDITERILSEDPDCVSFYCLWTTFHNMLRIARELKTRRPDLIVVLGGPQVTAAARSTMEAAPWVDYICTGEGENTVVPFFEALLRKNGEGLSEIPGLYYRQNGSIAFCDTLIPLCDLDKEPYWDDRLYRHLYDQPDSYTRSERYYMPVDVGRGCPYSCTFCCTSQFWRRTYRLKSPERIVGEMRRLNEMFGIRSFCFTHDAFTINHDLVTKVCDRIIAEGLDFRWRCSTRIDCVTEELILKMKQAGMREIEVGIETGSPRMQRLINKNLNLEKARRMIAFLLKNKLRVSLFFIYGLPEEGEADLEQTVNMALDMIDLGVHGLLMSFCCFTPATALTERYFDSLTLDPEKEIVLRHFYGDEEDMELIRNHKAVFPVYYDLPTPERRTYEHLWVLPELYRMYPRSLKLLRRHLGSDLLLFRRLQEANAPLFAGGIAALRKGLDEAPVSMAMNLAVQVLPAPRSAALQGLMRFEDDLRRLHTRGEDKEVRRIYDFLFSDLKLERPVERYGRGRTEILLRRRDQKISLQVLGMEIGGPDVLFIDPCDKRDLRQEVNGTLLLGTRLLEAGFSVEILRFWQIPHFREDHAKFVTAMVDQILEIRPKAVSFYSLWPQYHTVIQAAQLLKQRAPELPVIFGGPQPSATAMETMEAFEVVDYLCAGEGENTVVPFFEALLRKNGEGFGEIPGLYYRKDGKILTNAQDVPLRDLDTLPRWDDRLYLPVLGSFEAGRDSAKYWMGLDVGRGCPFSCTFCASSRFWRRTYRMKSPKRIVDDMEYFMEKFSVRSFSFAHDAFTVSRKLTEAVCDEIVARGLDVTWKCTTRVDCIDEDLIVKMKRAGLRQIELGVETGSERMQKLIRKNLDIQQVRQVVGLLQKHKIRVMLLFMYGFPEETEEDLAQSLDLMFDMMDSGVDLLNLSYCHFSPGTDMTRKYFDDLVLDPEIKMLERTVWGHADGEALFRSHKEIFPFRYHLHTPVRDRYQYLHFLVRLYLFLPRSARFLRRLYGGDGLRMYQDFYEGNRELLEQGYDRMEVILKEQPLTLIGNMLRGFDPVVARRMLELVRFDVNLWVVSHQSGKCVQQVYGFHYVDFLQKKPIEEFSEGKTEILLRSNGGKADLQVLRFII